MSSTAINTLEYAIVDIETTGGYAAGSGITEVAILIHDGQNVVERFETLINPQCAIPLSIQALTGINNELVANAPAFSDVARRIFDLLSGRVFVAHHVNFDYSFIKHHLQTAGYTYVAPKLCTVRMSRKIRPGLASYSLGRLCDVLEIPITHRHRAGGDAEATAILFTKLLEWDTGGAIREMLKKTSGHQQLPPNLPKEQVDQLPHSTGVYYFRDKTGKVIYVGKALDIHSRVTSHFTGHNPNPQRQQFLRHIHSVTHEPCGTELIALLLEATEIKRLWPAYNRALKRFEPKFAIYVYEDQQGYLRIAVGKYGKGHPPVQVFYRQMDAVNSLHALINEFELDRQYCSFGGTANHHAVRPHVVPPEQHNERLRSALHGLQRTNANFAVIDQGRNSNEKSCIWVENGNLYGMGYFPVGPDSFLDTETVKASLTRYTGTHYMMQLINSYAEKHPLKIWKTDHLTAFSFL
ncbi:exonuclease domain-containing protein [Parapedobacter lycopersici]|uniref:exonuclease domain-containing protein n=1 Tax=Parapedobacter lycopersici TaxID=1864939 RepID=UPI00214DB477|nr:exonuclease domain-containing protein [Parapedobacter lycopersici]